MRYRIFAGLFLLFLALAGLLFITSWQQKRIARQNAKAPNIAWRAVEGWSVAEIQDDLAKRHLVAAADFQAELKSSAASFDFLGITPKPKSLEGFLFPDTYFIAEQPSAASVINKMLANFKAKLTPQLQREILQQNKKLYDLLILASIVEREVGRNTVSLSQADLTTLQEERQTVAGIFLKRLQIGMPLQSDATIGYVTKKNSVQASSADLKIDSPYNTYKYSGLPPTPIANPSLSAIEAVIYPKPSDYLYFLTKKDGTAVYARTLAEQEANKIKYLK